MYGTDLSQYLSTLNLIAVYTTQQGTDVVTSLCEVQLLAEHFQTGDDRLTRFADTNDLNFLTHVDNTTLNTASRNRTTASDRHNVLYGHQERLVSLTSRIRDVLINSCHQLVDRTDPLRIAFQRLQSRTTDDRRVVAIETVLAQQFTNFHFYQVDQFFIIDHVALVQEYNDVRNTYLTSEQDVLTSLRHRTIGSSYYQDRTIHLSSTGDHVLNVVSVTWAVNMRIVTLFCLILNVCSIDRNTALFFFRSTVDLIVIHGLCFTTASQYVRNSSRQRRLTMVNVTDCTDINMCFRSVKFFFCHFSFSS